MLEIEGGIRIVSGTFPVDTSQSSSAADQIGLIIEADPDDPTSFQFRVPKEKAGTTHDRIAFYVSGSGRVGIGTKDPATAFDVRDVAEDEDPEDRVAKKRLMQGDRSAATVLTGSLKGNADTAGRLLNAVNIGGVSFTGQASINLPGVNTGGNQDTTGNAASATKLQTARTIGGVVFDGRANINLPGVNTTGNQNTSGTAESAGKVTVTGDELNASHPLTFIDNTAPGGQAESLKASRAVLVNPALSSMTIGGLTITYVQGDGRSTFGTVTFSGVDAGGQDRQVRLTME